MSQHDIEKTLINKYGSGREKIKDLDEALNLISIYGEDCELCIHSSIREKVYKIHQTQKNT
ncbi:hypothetical protein ACPUVO_15670 [Pseudocolwellia sp. HL-MZ19]|uniref:hypothetical protein n=1 Tax=Pseudocolwellia sp. HL-MZ19 TaxID=3400846 RepID=UPI003CF5B62E